MRLKEIGHEDLKSIKMPQGRKKERAVVKRVMKPRGP